MLFPLAEGKTEVLGRIHNLSNLTQPVNGGKIIFLSGIAAAKACAQKLCMDLYGKIRCYLMNYPSYLNELYLNTRHDCIGLYTIRMIRN